MHDDLGASNHTSIDRRSNFSPSEVGSKPGQISCRREKVADKNVQEHPNARDGLHGIANDFALRQSSSTAAKASTLALSHRLCTRVCGFETAAGTMFGLSGKATTGYAQSLQGRVDPSTEAVHVFAAIELLSETKV